VSGNGATRDDLAPERVRPLLAGRFGDPYVYEESCESTQRLLGPDLPEGAVAVCEEQKQGRGRLGRVWLAPPRTAILCSTVLRPPPGGKAAELSLVGGLATAETVEEALGASAEIKWPNDVLLGGRKVAGVLAEASGAVVVLGVGLNVNQAPEELPAAARLPAGSLFAADGVRRARAPLLAALLGRLEARYDRWRSGGLSALRNELARRDVLRGREIVVNGERALARGIDASGRLAIEIAGSRQLLESGEIELVGDEAPPD
jgi:BirA family transcriptional regulator, biotin operon repressor / biotin---[acetyl-CoA-carboxylase] ligase